MGAVRIAARPSLLQKLDNEAGSLCGWSDRGPGWCITWYEQPLVVRICWMFHTLGEIYRLGAPDTLLRAEFDAQALLLEAEQLDDLLKLYCEYFETGGAFQFVKLKMRERKPVKEVGEAAFDRARKLGSSFHLDRVLPPQEEAISLRNAMLQAHSDAEVMEAWLGASRRLANRVIEAAPTGCPATIGGHPQKDTIIATIDALGPGNAGRKYNPQLEALVRHIVLMHDRISFRSRKFTRRKSGHENEKGGPLIELFSALQRRFNIRGLPDEKKWKRIDDVPMAS